MRRRAPRGKEGRTAHLKIEIDAALGREIYRSLIPGSRIVLVPPPGRLLPDLGQPANDRIRPDRAKTRPAPLPAPTPTPEAGVPFRLPPPEDVPNGTPPPGSPPSESPAPAPAPGVAPEKPPPGSEPEPPSAEGEEGDAPLPDDWVPAEEETPEP
jgi:hypothetical protein